MKKSSHTMGRNIGIYVLGLLVFLAISCSQDVLAVNNVTLKVNAAASAMANKIYYKATGTAAQGTPVTLPWTEKAVFGGPTDAEVRITVKNEMAIAADLIIKVDILTATTGGALSVSSGWLKYNDGATEPFGVPAVVIATNLQTVDGTLVNKATLSSLVLKKVAAKTTITLFDFFTTFKTASHVIFTAVLVSDGTLPATAPVPSGEVMGVDVQSMFFNAVDAITIGTSTTLVPDPDDIPIWKTLIQADTTP